MRKLLALGVLAVVLPACGGGSTNTTPVTTPPTTLQPAASIAVTQASTAQVCISPLAAFALRLRVPVRIVESAGGRAHINFVRLSLFLRGAEVERREISANDVIAGVGTNIINPNSTQNVTIQFDFNTSNFDNFRLDFNFTDDRNNTTTVNIPSITATAVVTCSI